MEKKKRGNEEMTPTRGIPAFPRFPISSFPHLLISPFPLLLLAALLRFQGLAWGLPSARHWFSYHPDEALVLRAAANVNLFTGSLDTGFYNYGSFLIYCVSLVTQVLDSWSPLKSFPNAMARMTLVGRCEVALFGVATIYVVSLIARRLSGERAGWWAAAVMAVAPMHVMHSHFVTVDVPAAFWVSVALYNALRIPDGKRAALWCGLAAGIAAGTKYNSGLVLLAGWTAILFTRDAGLRAGDSLRAFLVMTSAAALGFLVTTPGVLLNQPAFLRDFGYELQHVRTGHGLVFESTGPGWWYHLSTNLWQGIGAFLPLAAAIAWALTLKQSGCSEPEPVLSEAEGSGIEGPSTPLVPRCAQDASTSRPLSPSPHRPRANALILIAFALPYFTVISAAAVRFQRYDIPLLPVLAIGAGLLFARLNNRLMLIPAAALLCTLVLAQGAVSTMSAPGGDLLETGQPYRGDPRDSVYEWFERMVPPGATIGLTREPWFFSPPFSAANGGPQTARMFERERSNLKYRIVTLPPDASGFDTPPDFVVISDYEYGDALRLQGAPVPERAAQLRPVSIQPDSPPEAKRIARLWNDLTSDYALVGVWAPRQRAFGLSWPKKALPPHDAFYPYPTIVVFRRDTGQAN